jgi:hypothetical protein
MATELDRFINRLRKKTKEVWKLHRKIFNNYREYTLLYSTNLHWPTKPIKEIFKLYRELYDMHQQFIQDIGKLIPNVRYLTRRPDALYNILYDLERNVINMRNVQRELIDMQNHILSAANE